MNQTSLVSLLSKSSFESFQRPGTTTEHFNRRSQTNRRSSMLLLATVLLVLSTSNAWAQTNSGPNPRPEPGSPVGSYALNNLETVNYFNGRLHFQLPLLTIGGRGDAHQTVILTIDPAFPGEGKGCPGCSDYYQLSAAMSDIEAGYSPGVLQVVQESTQVDAPCAHPKTVNDATRTLLKFKAADGTEYSLVDELHDGQVMQNIDLCGNGPLALRGKIFVTKDASGVIFISDVDIYDSRGGLSVLSSFPSGVLKFRDGTVYRIDNGLVTSLTDRNGNKITYEYGPPPTIFPSNATYLPGRVTKITDSLGREVKFTYDNATPVATERYDEIKYKGVGETARTIRVDYVRLEHALPKDSKTKTYCQLSLDCETPGAKDKLANPLVVSSVTLPDGRQYSFSYDEYAELTRYQLPTGGAVEFDYDWGVHDPAFTSDTYRRVVERRTYPDGSTGLFYEGKTVYSRPEQTVKSPCDQNLYYGATTVGYVDVEHRDQWNGLESPLISVDQHYYYGMAVSPSNNTFGGCSSNGRVRVHTIRPFSDNPWKDGREYKTEYLKSDETTVLLSQEFEFRQVTPDWSGSADLSPENNPHLVGTTTTLTDVSPKLVKKETAIDPDNADKVGFDTYNNQTDVWEYDYGADAPGTLLRHTHTKYVTDQTYIDAYLRSLPQEIDVIDGSSNSVSKTTFSYDESSLLTYTDVVSGWTDPNTTVRGNATTVSRWLSATDKWLSNHTQYDQLGNVRKLWDARDSGQINPSQIEYSSSFQFAYPTLITSADPDKTSSSSDGPLTAHKTSFDYDKSTGLKTSTTDANGSVSRFYYLPDELDRLTATYEAADTAAERRTYITYDDANHKVTTTSDQDTKDDKVLNAQLLYDGFGRAVETRAFENSQVYIATQTQYDALGRSFKTSNPFRSGETALWNTTVFDALGRIVELHTPDNAVAKTAYSGNRILVQDQIGKGRISKTDGLGRLTDVWEITASDSQTEKVSFSGHSEVKDGYRTQYAYDALSNLVSVTSGATQTRTFTYDSLSRLLSATNPECGKISYAYDANGNLISRTDARTITTTYVYDALNRLITRKYNDNTARADYSYDTVSSNGMGRLAKVSSSTADYEYTSYDKMGRVLTAKETIHAVTDQSYSISYTYDLAGHVKTITYPSLHVVTNTYDNAGRLQTLAGTLGDGSSRTYSSGIAYSPFGGMTEEKLGTTTAIFNKRFYDSRGRLAAIREGLKSNDTSWERGAIINDYSDNGNLKKQEHWIPDANGVKQATFTQQYDYDDLNRLQQTYDGDASQPIWKQQYGYDRFGNRTISTTTSAGLNSTQFDTGETASSNRLYAPGDTNLVSISQRKMRYDAAGNLIFDSYTGAGSRVYDAENRMTSAAGNGGAQTYGYDGVGRRVKRVVNGIGTWQVFGAGGELLAEYGAGDDQSLPEKEYGYRNGQLLVTAAVSSRVSAWGAAPAFDDNPLYPRETTVRASHITQLRAAINAVRRHRNLADYPWQYSATTNDKISASPIVEMRTALDQALGAPSGGYSAGLGSGQPVKAIHIQELRDRVLGAWNSAGGTSSLSAPSLVVDLRWMVTDQLGTPRMVFDESGSLAKTTRHDYLPFGEEIFAGTLSRTTALGYTTADGARQKFTGKERDTETGLDYFGARYYTNVMGRFITPDWAANPTPVPYANFSNPQSLNLYAYVGNNPTSGVDADGHLSKEKKEILKGVGGAILKFAWDNSELGMQYNLDKMIDNIRKNPKGAAKQFVAALKKASTLVRAGSGDLTAQIELGTAAAKSWQGMSTRQKASAVTTATLTVATVAVTAGAGGAEEAATAVPSEVAAATEETTYVIGSGPARLALEGQDGFNVLNVPSEIYSLELQADWVQTGMNKGAPFLMKSSADEGTFLFDEFSEVYAPSPLGNELTQLLNNTNYTQVGNRLVSGVKPIP